MRPQLQNKNKKMSVTFQSGIFALTASLEFVHITVMVTDGPSGPRLCSGLHVAS